MNVLDEDFPAVVQTTHGVSMTEYRIEGSLAGVFREITDVFRAFPAAGYGTRVHHIQAEGFSGSLYTARMSRSNSCG